MGEDHKIRVTVQEAPFDCGALLNAFKAGHLAGTIGALTSFTGTVRDLAGTLESLTLEHYPAMTEQSLNAIAKQAAARFGLDHLWIIHRYGRMSAGDDIVFVAASAAHRHAAFDGCRYVMDFLKTDAPFWKQESLQDGSKAWVAAKASDDDARDSWKP